MRVRLPDSPWTAVVVAALLLACFLALRLVMVGGPATFVVAGDRYVDVSVAPNELPVMKGSGYDGQFAYRMALAPLSGRLTSHGITFDSPAYRSQRVLTPSLAWALVRVTPLSVALCLLLVNVLALVIAAYFAARLVQRFGGHAGWGVLVALSFGLVIPLARDLTEPVAWAATLAALELWLAGRRPAAALLFTAAVLARETSLLVPAGLGIWALVALLRSRFRRGWATVGWLLVPLVVEVGWQLHLRRVWGELPVRGGSDNVGPPFLGVLRTIVDVDGARAHPVWEVERLAVLSLLLWAAIRLWRSPFPPGLRIAWGFAAALALSLGGWTYDAQFLRAVNEAVGLSLLVLIVDRTASSRLLLSGAGLLSLYVGWQYTGVV